MKTKQPEGIVEEFKKKIWEWRCSADTKQVVEWLTKALQSQADKYWAKGHEAGTKEARQDLLKEMLKECNRTENEAGRLLVEQFNGK
jgi:hypothetical protein